MMELTEALFAQQQVARLQALLEASRLIHSTIDLDQVLRTVLQIVVRELELTGSFFSQFPHTYGDVPIHILRGETVAKGLAPTQEISQQLRLPLRDKAGREFTELVVLFPTVRTLSIDEIDFLASLAIQASVAVENARFHDARLGVAADRNRSRRRPRHSAQSAATAMPEIPGYSIAAHSVTCYEVGGDYLDIVPLPSGETIFVVADVAGKGLSSALVSTSFRAALRAMAISGITCSTWPHASTACTTTKVRRRSAAMSPHSWRG